MKKCRPEVKSNVPRPPKEVTLPNGEKTKIGSSGIFDLFDDSMKFGFNITDEEYDFICENASDEDLDSLILSEGSSFSSRRRALEVRNKYLELYNNGTTE